jgi:hypothetical protein
LILTFTKSFRFALSIFTQEENPRHAKTKVKIVSTRMIGKDPHESGSTGICDIHNHNLMKLVGQPEPYERGNDSYQSCDRFSDFFSLARH